MDFYVFLLSFTELCFVIVLTDVFTGRNLENETKRNNKNFEKKKKRNKNIKTKQTKQPTKQKNIQTGLLLRGWDFISLSLFICLFV